MELARSFGELLQQGWRPRRSIVFASWAAEEYGLEGSYEWVYENKVLDLSENIRPYDVNIFRTKQFIISVKVFIFFSWDLGFQMQIETQICYFFCLGQDHAKVGRSCERGLLCYGPHCQDSIVSGSSGYHDGRAQARL
jgi:hypothetical protein